METQPREIGRTMLENPGLRIEHVIRRAGGGIRWVHHRTIVYSFLIAVALHLAMILAYTMSHPAEENRHRFRTLPLLVAPRDTHYIAIDMRHVTVVNPGGGGGAPDVRGAVGKARAGDPDAAPRFDPTKRVDPRKARAFAPKVPLHPVTTDRSADTRPVAATDRDTARKASSGEGLRGQHPDGSGLVDASGSGGRGIGHGIGVGIGDGEGLGGRGWLRPPSRKSIDGMEVEGSVRLAFTVMPNGEIISIAPIKKASPLLLAEAVRRLGSAKVKPLPASAPQVPVRSALTFNFELR